MKVWIGSSSRDLRLDFAFVYWTNIELHSSLNSFQTNLSPLRGLVKNFDILIKGRFIISIQGWISNQISYSPLLSHYVMVIIWRFIHQCISVLEVILYSSESRFYTGTVSGRLNLYATQLIIFLTSRHQYFHLPIFFWFFFCCFNWGTSSPNLYLPILVFDCSFYSSFWVSPSVSF